jgi:polar amino acid transport system substrate-binding protein
MVRTNLLPGAAAMLGKALLTGSLGIFLVSGATAQGSNTNKAENQAHASACQKLSVGGADGWEPVTYTREDGKPAGLGLDILQSYAKNHGITLEIRLDIPWSRSIQMLEKGELDVLAGAYFTAERNQIFFYSAPFAYDEIMVFQDAENEFDVTGLRDLIGYRGARPQGGSYGDYIDSFAEQRLDMIYSPTGDRILDLLQTGRVDYVMLGRFDGLANIYRDGLADEITIQEQPLEKNEVRLLFSRTSPCLPHVKNINLLIEKLEEDGSLQRWTEAHLIDISESGS